MTKTSAIIVAHNSEKHIRKAVHNLLNATVTPDRIVVVDSGSNDITYLTQFQGEPRVRVVLEDGDVGFCRGNNIGWQHIDQDSDYVLFINPDAFVTENFLSDAISFMEENDNVGALTPPLLGYDIDTDKPTGRYDSTGIFRTWYGHWYDRDQGQPTTKHFDSVEALPAICGALMFCRKKALDQVLINDQVFDESFYMYKEDVDLSQRLTKKGWMLALLPNLTVYHCRGWATNRKLMPRKFRLASARNDLRVNQDLGLLGLTYSGLKYLAVLLFNL